MTLRNILITGGAGVALALVALVLPTRNSIETIEVPNTTISVSANTASSVLTPVSNTSDRSTSKKVLNLNLDADNVVFFNTEVDGGSVEDVIRTIQRNEEEGRELYIILDCPGGSVFDGARLISYMESAKIKVNTVVYGIAASMCAHIHAHGAKRYVLDRSTLMYHLASGGVQGTMNNMKSLLSYVDRTTQKLDAYIAKRAGIDNAKWSALVAADLWIDGEDAVALGLADSLVTVNVRNANFESSSLVEDNIIKNQKELKGIININPLKNFR